MHVNEYVNIHGVHQHNTGLLKAKPKPINTMQVSLSPLGIEKLINIHHNVDKRLVKGKVNKVSPLPEVINRGYSKSGPTFLGPNF